VSEIINSLLSSPFFYLAVCVLLLVVIFRKQLASLIDRTTEASGKLGEDGIEGVLKASSQFDENKKSGEAGLGVDMNDVSLDGASEISSIKGNVKLDKVRLDKNSKIGKIES
jgi:hypothetical protein